MQRAMFSSGGLPEYHPNLVIASVFPVGKLGDRSMAMAGGSTAALGEPLELDAAPGLGMLDRLARSGRIRGVTPLARTRETDFLRFGFSRGPRLAEAMVMNAVVHRDEKQRSLSVSRGVHFIETESEEDAEALRRELSGDPNVLHASRVPVRYLHAARQRSPRTPAATPPGTDPDGFWNLRRIEWRRARALKTHVEPEDIRVAVLDTGIDAGHPDFAGRVDRYTWEHSDLPVANGANDIIGHGTHVAGIIGATLNNALGVAGICHCRLQAWKIFSDEPVYDRFSQSFAYFVHPVMYRRALLDCIDDGVQVINLSIGGPARPSPDELQIFNLLTEEGIAVVAAMGNERSFGSPISYPAAIPDVIAVGATRPDDRVSRFSNRGPHIWTCAPGVAIWSTLPRYPGQSGFDVRFEAGVPVQGKPHYRETDYDAWDGTSMATPHVAGAVACLLAKKGPLPVGSVREQLRVSADPVAGMNGDAHHVDYGYGRLNLLKLLS